MIKLQEIFEEIKMTTEEMNETYWQMCSTIDRIVDEIHMADSIRHTIVPELMDSTFSNIDCRVVDGLKKQFQGVQDRIYKLLDNGYAYMNNNSNSIIDLHVLELFCEDACIELYDILRECEVNEKLVDFSTIFGSNYRVYFLYKTTDKYISNTRKLQYLYEKVAESCRICIEIDQSLSSACDVQSRDGNDWDTVVFDKKSACGPNSRVCECAVSENTCGINMTNAPKVELDKVHFSAVAPKTLVKGEYSLIEIFMYEDNFRELVDEVINDSDSPVQETKSGTISVEKRARIKVTLYSPDLILEDNTEELDWYGEFARFSFPVEMPLQYRKPQILFVATVYINDVIATRLKFIAKCKTLREQKMEVVREDILSAFVSYASQDRQRVAMIVQGMKKARPEMDIFFDVESLRSGDDWEKSLWTEIDKRDVLFLCWSHFAKESKWVDAEWRYAFDCKGIDCIEPVPIESPDLCPPPEELAKKHFNDKLLYVINAFSTTNNSWTKE